MPNNTSTPLPDAQAVTGLDQNRLRQDVLNNHAHEGPNDGGAISHTNLADKGTYTHPQIDEHINTALSGGVHGVPPGSTLVSAVAGEGYAVSMFSGKVLAETYTEYGGSWTKAIITFPAAFAVAPTAVASPVKKDVFGLIGFFIDDVSTTGFVIYIHGADDGSEVGSPWSFDMNWIAIGLVAAP